MNVQHVLSPEELETLIAAEPEDEKIKARVAFRHHRAMQAITDKSRTWATTIGRIHMEEILGDSVDL